MTEENKVILDTDKLPNFANTFIDINTYRRLEQENKELKETIEAFKTMATVPTRMYNECERERCKYGRALEGIKEVLKFYADSWVDEKIYPNLHYDNTKAKEGLSRINEVLNDI